MCPGGGIRERFFVVCTKPLVEDENSRCRVIVLRTRAPPATARTLAIGCDQVAIGGGAAFRPCANKRATSEFGALLDGFPPALASCSAFCRPLLLYEVGSC